MRAPAGGSRAAPPAVACGGFFCGQQPVDQSAERVVFAVDQEANQTTMIVQIAFQGNAADFAWVVPLGNVPVEGSLDTFPQLALSALDANTGPQIYQGGGCFEADAAAGAPSSREDDGGVTVHVREEVGPYDVAVIESDDPSALVEWLRENGFRVTTPMEPYIAEYTAAGYWQNKIITDFLDALDQGSAPRVTARDALHVHRLIDALLRSAEEGRRIEIAAL